MSLIQKMIDIAKSQVGYHEGHSNGHWNNREKFAAEVPGLAWVSENGEPWCAVFVSWAALKSGAAEYFPRTASTDAGAKWFRDKGQFHQYPAVGAQVFFGTNGDMNHTGLVYDYDDEFIYTVEGNTNDSGSREGDGVYLKKRERHSDHVQGYGYPAVPEGLKSADPKWTHTPKPAPAPKPDPKPPVKPPVKPTPKPDPKPPVKHAPALEDNVRPDKRAPQVKLLQSLLIKAGYGPIQGAPSTMYGVNTQAAVGRFHRAHPQFGRSNDFAIGPHGFDFLWHKVND